MATTPVTTNKQLEVACTNCGTMFHRRPGGRSTCNTTCKSAAQRKQKAPKITRQQQKVERRKKRLTENAFGLWFIGQAERAGTVQTYQGIDAAGLRQLLDLHNYRKKRYGWVESGHGKDSYHLCHVQGLKGRDGSTGLTTSLNLFAGLDYMNQQHGNKPVNSWAGESIPKSARKRKWDITPDMTLDQKLQKLADFLGSELDTFLDELDVMPQRTVRLRLARSIHKRQGDELYEPLDRRYTLDELVSLKMDELQALETIQDGREKNKDFLFSNCPPDSMLGVMHDELKRFSADLPEGKHRDNCRFMLSLVRLLGIYLAQIGNAEGKSRNRFLSLQNATWTPLQYCHPVIPWRTPASLLESDRESLVKAITESAHNALQGLNIDGEALEAQLEERLHLQTLVPVVMAPDQWSWEACGSGWLNYIDNLYASLEGTWQALLDLGLCTDEQVFAAQDGILLSLQTAVELARKDHRNQRRFTLYGIPFERYPAYLVFPPVEVEPIRHLGA
ncbi:hypothetical protein [Pseudomonas sp. URMO17WK12:I11]|uniref:hypothetical protein n=1 Tax=Pseudomonas sp. URMO17WK12:I11 TaxID=1283291 RepID=UPI00071FA9B3|nr:hypothetical protein [Pseudomonas sp. URMO17WK12:I11]CRL48353.1 hypothetical protein PSHI_14070 [Pseudomonas sp. URMO17WK12:I11]